MTSWILNRLHIFTPTVYRTRRGREEGVGGGGVAAVNGDKNVSCPKQGSETLRILSCKQGRDSWCQRQTPVQLSLKYHPEDFTS